VEVGILLGGGGGVDGKFVVDCKVAKGLDKLGFVEYLYVVGFEMVRKDEDKRERGLNKRDMVIIYWYIFMVSLAFQRMYVCIVLGVMVALSESTW